MGKLQPNENSQGKDNRQADENLEERENLERRDDVEGERQQSLEDSGAPRRHDPKLRDDQTPTPPKAQSQPNKKLRIAYMVNNAFLYAMFLGVTVFIAASGDGLDEIQMFDFWVFMWFGTLILALLGSFQIYTWIKQGKL